MKRFLKSSLSIFLAITIIFSSAIVGLNEIDFKRFFAVKAETASSGYCGEALTWTLDDEGTLTISGMGEMYDFSTWRKTPWSSYKNKIKTVIIEFGVTSIGGGAFFECGELTTVNIADSVTSIGDYAFSNCNGLVEISISDNIEDIGEMAFVGTGYYLDESNWENGVLYLSCYLLSGNSSIVVYDMGDADSKCFEHDYDPDYSDGVVKVCIKEGTRVISGNAFCGCWNITSVTIPDSVEIINYMAFTYCDVLEYVFYMGTEVDRNNIIIDNRNEGLDSAIWHYEASEHTAGEWITDEDSTCTVTGSKHKECIICKFVIENAVIEPTGHKAGSWETTKKATVTAAGKKVKKCTKCGEVLETATIKQLKCSKPKLREIENTSSGVKITWGKVSGADKYYVYCKVKGGSYSKIGTATKTSYTDKKAKSGKTYYYYVKAINEAGGSEASSSKSILYLADTTLKTPSSTKKGITLKWSKVTGAEGYQVWRKTGSGSYKKLATVKGNSKVTYTDKDARKGKTYTYKIKAYKSKTTSAYSNAKKIKDKY